MQRGLKDFPIGVVNNACLTVSQCKEDWKIFVSQSRNQYKKCVSMQRGLKESSLYSLSIIDPLSQCKEDWKLGRCLSDGYVCQSLNAKRIERGKEGEAGEDRKGSLNAKRIERYGCMLQKSLRKRSLNAKRIESLTSFSSLIFSLPSLNAKRIERIFVAHTQVKGNAGVSMQRGRSEEGQSSCA